jgi:soluble cytochrome b562
MVLVKVVNITGSTVHISNPDTVLGAGMSLTISEDDMRSSNEILGAVSSRILEVVPVDIEAPVKAEEIVEGGTDGTVDESPNSEAEEEKVIFSDADMNSGTANDSSFVKTKNGIVEINPETAEEVEPSPKNETDEKEYVDGIEVLTPAVDKTVKVAGVEMVVDENGEPEYDDAFIDTDI